MKRGPRDTTPDFPRASTAWMASARCRGLETAVFFPPDDDRRRQHVLVERAKAICGECRVRNACLEFAIAHNETGVWGGRSQTERDRMADRRRGDV